MEEKPENYILELNGITPKQVLSKNVTKMDDLFGELIEFKESDSKLFNIISSQYTFELTNVIPASNINILKAKDLKPEKL